MPGRHMNPLAFLIQGFRRHRVKLEREMKAFYREMLVPTPANMYFIANFQPKGQPSLEAVMKDLDVDSPFMQMNNSWYTLRPADQPALQLAVKQENHLWVLCLTNSTSEPAGVAEEATRERIIEPSARLLGDSPLHLSVKPPGPGEHEPPGRLLGNAPVHPSAKPPGTYRRSPGYYRNDEPVRGEPSVGEIKRPSVIVKSSRSSSFSFQALNGRFGSTHYRLVSADLPDGIQLVVPNSLGAARRTRKLFFDSRQLNHRGMGIDVIKMAGEDRDRYVIVHKAKDCVLFLSFRGEHSAPGIPELVFNPQYPGSSAHWLLQPTPRPL
ncbi:uncharacterized protein LOC119586159 isoform X1 [Penaeus monodon]|uniref:uncharacterized protein LOC119586159 isoform X1 n=2 Tax=Penaeus monodon TaxID=6687 RepID=UPI0018A7527F|nr:uncharacterized protein LOC119586159 isoform X1 [Penaeus monodon]